MSKKSENCEVELPAVATVCVASLQPTVLRRCNRLRCVAANGPLQFANTLRCCGVAAVCTVATLRSPCCVMWCSAPINQLIHCDSCVRIGAR